MKPIVFRMGVFAALRSLFLQGKAVGIMITASHNPEEDNGVKIIDPSGDMLESSWEPYADELANTCDGELDSKIDALKKELFPSSSSFSGGPTAAFNSISSTVVLGRDTRKSGKELSQIAIQGILKVGGKIQDFGLVTTPQLHFLTAQITPNFYKEIHSELYFITFSKAFERLIKPFETDTIRDIPPLYLDTANGIGGLAMAEITKKIIKVPFKIYLLECGSSLLNEKCGADYVKMTNSAPVGIEIFDGKRYASLDGDADRLVYFYSDNGTFKLIDGDRLSILFAFFIDKHLEALGLKPFFTMGVVLTAYSNGATIRFLKEKLKIPVQITNTGVKNLHSAAKDYDVGIYFEANGHGTVLFSHAYRRKLSTLSQEINHLAPEKKNSVCLLEALVDLINPYIGDAISDMLAIEAILYHLNFTLRDWYSLYQALPSTQAKIPVLDRSRFKSYPEDEQRLMYPEGIQDKIQNVLNRYPSSRAFVRPSGTEQVVRIYAEAVDYNAANRIIEEIRPLILDNHE